MGIGLTLWGMWAPSLMAFKCLQFWGLPCDLKPSFWEILLSSPSSKAKWRLQSPHLIFVECFHHLNVQAYDEGVWIFFWKLIPMSMFLILSWACAKSQDEGCCLPFETSEVSCDCNLLHADYSTQEEREYRLILSILSMGWVQSNARLIVIIHCIGSPSGLSILLSVITHDICCFCRKASTHLCRALTSIGAVHNAGNPSWGS